MITQAEINLYLRLDAPVDADVQAEVDSMVAGAIAYLEKKTGYIWAARDQDYLVDADGFFRVYDYPINTDLAASTWTYKNRHGYTWICAGDVDTITLNVGYTVAADLPEPIRQAALELVSYWYYQSEQQGASEGARRANMIPDGVARVIELYRRFTI